MRLWLHLNKLLDEQPNTEYSNTNNSSSNNNNNNKANTRWEYLFNFMVNLPGALLAHFLPLRPFSMCLFTFLYTQHMSMITCVWSYYIHGIPGPLLTTKLRTTHLYVLALAFQYCAGISWMNWIVLCVLLAGCGERSHFDVFSQFAFFSFSLFLFQRAVLNLFTSLEKLTGWFCLH